MKSLAKAQALSRDLAQKLKIRFAGSATIDTVRETVDSNSWPMIFLSDGGVETAGSAVIAIRIQQTDAVSKDIFGNSNLAYSPHVMEVAYELTAADNPIPTDKDVLVAEFEAIKCGVKLQLKELANTTAVTAANMDAASATIELDDLYWPNKGN